MNGFTAMSTTLAITVMCPVSIQKSKRERKRNFVAYRHLGPLHGSSSHFSVY